MLGVLSEIGTAALRLYIAAGSAALLVAFFVTAFVVPRTKTGAAVRAMLVVFGAVLGAAMTWAFLGGPVLGDQGGERRALQTRAEELTARSLAPGSPLACLDAVAGEGVEAACERAIFASPTNVATATSYIAARLALLSELVAYVRRGGADVDDVLLPLRRSLEADRFGFLGHLLATRDACTSQNCTALALLRDASRVRTNLSEDTFDRYLDHYQAVWAKSAEGPVADIQPPPMTHAAAQPPRQAVVNADFPSAASIPAVSIMNPEPTGPVLPGIAAAAAANPNPPPPGQTPSSRRSRKQAAAPPPQPAAQATTPRSAPAVEPIWPEPVPPAPQPNAPPAGTAPAQFNPFGPGPNAFGPGPNGSAGTRAQ